MKRVLLGLGSNRTFNNRTPLENLECACADLKRLLADPSFSSVYKTKAMYVEDQDDFYNMAVLGFIADDFDAFEFLKIINKIEEKYGRNRQNEIRFGPRPLDIDIELFGDEKYDTEILTVPHPRIKERAFVLIPAIEILDNSADIQIRREYEECLEKLKKQGEVSVEKIDSYGTRDSKKFS